MTEAPRDDNPWRRDWDERARRGLRLTVATWYARSNETWREGARRDAAYLMERLPPELGPGQACLDLGCGPGRLLPSLAQRFDRVVGCDVSPEMLRHAREHVGQQPRIELYLTDGRTLAGLPDGAFAFVLANAVFIHLDRPTVESLLRDTMRVLAPRGLFAGTFNSAEPPGAAGSVVSEATTAAAKPAPLRRDPPPEPLAPLAPLPPPVPTADELSLIGGPTWDGARFSRPELLAMLKAMGLRPDSVDQLDTSWNVIAWRERAV
jgi:SAM-dependent methyltransferase